MPYDSDSQRALGRNSKANDTARDENDDTTSTQAKATASMTLNRKTTEHRKPLLQVANTAKPPVASPPRQTLLDNKSSSHGQTSSILTSNDDGKDTIFRSRQHYPSSKNDHIQRNSGLQLSQLRPSATDRKASSYLRNPSNQQQQQQQQHFSTDTSKSNDITTSTTKAEVVTATSAANEAATLKVFFEDNQHRYKPTSADDRPKKIMEPTPVIPIIVSDKMKSRIREQYLSKSSKRPHEDMYKRDGPISAASKRQKSGEHDHHQLHNEDTSHKPPSTSTATATTTATTSNIPSSHVSTSRHSIPSFSALESRNEQQQPTTNLVLDQQTHDIAKELDDQQEHRARQKLSQPNLACQRNDDIAPQDKPSDPMLVTEYADEINAYLHDTEANTLPDPNYIRIQKEITWKMRDVLIDWVAEVHYLFRLLPETFFLTVNIIDRFLSKREVSTAKLQLVAITSLFLATKFEENIAPPVRQYIYMTGNIVTEEELLKAERYILQVLDFKLCSPDPLQFFRRCTMTDKFDLTLRLMTKYFMEITCVDHRFIGTPPSLVAASSLWLAKKIISKGEWTSELIELSGYKAQDLKPTVELILDYLSQPVKNTAFFKKWASRRMMTIGVIVRNWVEHY
ncbi:unnamed protein product [Absidia cylindrospora]